MQNVDANRGNIMNEYIFCVCITQFGWFKNNHTFMDGTYVTDINNGHLLLQEIKDHVKRNYKHFANDNIEVISIMRM